MAEGLLSPTVSVLLANLPHERFGNGFGEKRGWQFICHERAPGEVSAAAHLASVGVGSGDAAGAVWAGLPGGRAIELLDDRCFWAAPLLRAVVDLVAGGEPRDLEGTRVRLSGIDRCVGGHPGAGSSDDARAGNDVPDSADGHDLLWVERSLAGKTSSAHPHR